MHRNEYDTIKFTLDLDLCQQPNEETYREYYSARPTQAGYLVAICKPVHFGYFGFNFIKINTVERTVFLEISSKILRENYAQGLHSGNFGTAIDLINRSGLLYIFPKTLETAEATWLDLKADRTLPRSMAETIRITKAVHVPNKFKVATGGKLSRRTFQTLYFERNAVSDKPDYIFRMYKKGEEIKDQKNLPFIQSLKENGPAVVIELAGKVRIERSLKNKAAIRKAYGLAKDKKPLLLPLLQSTCNPLLAVWEEILKDFAEAKPITVENTPLPNMNLYKFFIQKLSTNPNQDPIDNEKDVNAFTTLMAYHFDLLNVYLYVEQTFPNKNTRTTRRKYYRSMLSQWQQFQNQVSSTDFAVFSEISAALKDKPATQVALIAAVPVADVPTTDVQRETKDFSICWQR